MPYVGSGSAVFDDVDVGDANAVTIVAVVVDSYCYW